MRNEGGMTGAAEIDRAVVGRTFTGMFRDTVASRGGLPAIWWREGDGFREWTWEIGRASCRERV